MEIREQGIGMEKRINDFTKGLIVGIAATAILFGVILALRFFHNRDKGLIEYAERQIEIEALREDYSNRDPVEFLEVPGVGDALRDAQSEFDRKRDEALYRFRSGLAD
jgi:type VI protein secretion system component VasK